MQPPQLEQHWVLANGFGLILSSSASVGTVTTTQTAALMGTGSGSLLCLACNPKSRI